MEERIKVVLAGLLICICLDLHAQKRKLVRVYTFDNVDMLEMRPGYHFFNHSHLLGDVKLADSGIYFIPRTEAPEGLSEKFFKSHWWYNPLFKELYISYKDIEGVRTGASLRIKTTDGRKYRIVSRKFIKYEAEIEQHIAAIKKPVQRDRAHAGN